MNSEIEILKQRIENTEKCLLRIVGILIELQPVAYYEEINDLMNAYYEPLEQFDLYKDSKFKPYTVQKKEAQSS